MCLSLRAQYPLWVVLVVAGGLGILVTYAEPAISSLTPLAKLVDKTKAPYLYYALNDQREMLVGKGLVVNSAHSPIYFRSGLCGYGAVSAALIM